MSDSPSGTTDSPALATAPVPSSRDVTPATESTTTSTGDASESTTSTGRSSAEAPSLIAEATLEPPPIPSPRPENDNTALTSAEASIPPPPVTSPTPIATDDSLSHSSDTFSGDASEVGSVSAAQQDIARPVAEATYIPPPVHDLASHDANSVGRNDDATSPVGSTTDATVKTDARTPNDVGGSDGSTNVADLIPTSPEPITETAVRARTAGDVDGGQAPPPDLSDDMSGHNVSTVIDAVAVGVDSTWSAGALDGTSDHAQNETMANGVSDPANSGTDADSDRAALSNSTAAGTTADHTNPTAAPGGNEADHTHRAASPGGSEASPAAATPSVPDTPQTDPRAPSAAVDQITGETSSGIPDSGETDAVQRYSLEDLGAFVAYGAETNHALYEGPDGLLHAVGDEVGRGLRRDKAGRLRDATRYVNDDNKLAPNGIDALAVPGPPVDRMPAPATPHQIDQREVLHVAALERAEMAAAKADVWANQVEPLVERLTEAGLSIDRNTFGSNKFMDRLTDAAEQGLPRDLRVATVAAAKNYQQASANLVEASEALGTAGGSFAVSLFYPDGQTITSSDGIRGSPDTFDRTVYDESQIPTLIIIEEKGAGSSLGVRMVDNPNNPGERIRSQQNSPEYVHDLLEKDATLAAALHADPPLYEAVRSVVEGSNGGAVECLLVHTSAEGVVNVTPYLLDADRFRRDTIQLPAGEGNT